MGGAAKATRPNLPQPRRRGSEGLGSPSRYCREGMASTEEPNQNPGRGKHECNPRRENSAPDFARRWRCAQRRCTHPARIPTCSDIVQIFNCRGWFHLSLPGNTEKELAHPAGPSRDLGRLLLARLTARALIGHHNVAGMWKEQKDRHGNGRRLAPCAR